MTLRLIGAVTLLAAAATGLGAAAKSGLGAAAPVPQARPKAFTQCGEEPGWDDPAEPFHVFGNTWYVGTCGITALLVTSPRGHILIDGATEKGGEQIAANIVKLGFRMADVKAMVASHAHGDHVGGFAHLQRLSGAPVWSRGDDVIALRAGRGGPKDPQYRSAPPFPAVAEVREARPGRAVRVGPLALMPVDSTGHTLGGTSWTWRSCEGAEEGGRCLSFAYVDSLTAISDDGFRYSDAAANPGLKDRFVATVARIGQQPCDVLLTPHPTVSAMWQRLGPGATQPLIQRGACRALAERAHQRLAERLAKEVQ